MNNENIKQFLSNVEQQSNIFQNLSEILQDEDCEIYEMINFAPYYIIQFVPPIAIFTGNTAYSLGVFDYVQPQGLPSYEHLNRFGEYKEIYDLFEKYINLKYGIQQHQYTIQYPLVDDKFKLLFIPITISSDNLNQHKVEETINRLVAPFKNCNTPQISDLLVDKFKKEFETILILYHTFILNRSNYYNEQIPKKLEKDLFETSMQDLFVCFSALYIGNFSSALWSLHQHIEKMIKKFLINTYPQSILLGPTPSPKTHDIKKLTKLLEKSLNSPSIPKVKLTDNVDYRYRAIEKKEFFVRYGEYQNMLKNLLPHFDMLTKTQKEICLLNYKEYTNSLQYNYPKNHILRKLKHLIYRFFSHT